MPANAANNDQKGVNAEGNWERPLKAMMKEGTASAVGDGRLWSTANRHWASAVNRGKCAFDVERQRTQFLVSWRLLRTGNMGAERQSSMLECETTATK